MLVRALQVEEALKKLDAQEKALQEEGGDKRKFNSLNAVSENVTPEEMEAWRIKKARPNDPMAQVAKGTKAAGAGANADYDFL